MHKENAHTSIQVQRENTPGLPRANGFTVSFVLSLVTGFVATIAPRAFDPQKLDASIGASEPHDFAVRFSAVRRQHIRVHRNPTARIVTIATRPLIRRETRGTMPLICPTGMKQENFVSR